MQPWGNVKAPLGMPKNAATGRAYSGINVLILRSPASSAASTHKAGPPSARRSRPPAMCARAKRHDARLCRPLHSLPRAHARDPFKTAFNNRSENAQPAILELVGIVYEDIEFEEGLLIAALLASGQALSGLGEREWRGAEQTTAPSPQEKAQARNALD